MSLDLNRISSHITPVKPIQQPPVVEQKTGKGEFAETLKNVASTRQPIDVTFSAHASKRLIQRGISLNSNDLEKINTAMDQAKEKGAKESLFVLRDLALLVSVENRTVITALHGESAKDNVFTKIDSAVLL